MMDPFDWLLRPYSAAQFFETYYERAPLHVARNRPEYYEAVFSLDELERVLYGTEVGAGQVILYQDGFPTRREAFVRKNGKKGAAAREIVDTDRISALFASGCSIVFDSIQDSSDSMARLIAGLEAAFEHRVNANVYATPPKSQGFTAHYDTHDAVIMQIAGSKRWRIYGSPTHLPLESQPHDKKSHVAGEPISEFDLQPGDLLYVPRGFMHDARANEALSLHVTLGLFPVLWFDVLKEAVEAASRSDAILRQTAPAGARGFEDVEKVAEAVRRAFSSERLIAARQGIRRSYVIEHRNGLEGQLHQIAMLPELSPASTVAIRSGLIFELDEAESATKLLFSNKALTLPAGAGALVRTLRDEGPQRVQNLMRIESNALVVIRKLIEEGFVYARARAPRTAKMAG